MRKANLRIAPVFCIALLAAGARADERDYGKEWNATLVATARMLKSGAYAEALPKLNALTSEMLKVLGPSDVTAYVLIVPLIQTALAEEGMGDHRAALWHWQMAQALDPKVTGADLSAFGAPGVFLEQNLLANPRPGSCRQERPSGTVLPVPAKQVEPLYPEGARKSGLKGLVIVDLIVGVDGVPREPRLVKPLEAPLSFTALDALRHWTFTPGQLDGKPVETNYCAFIQFKLN